MTRMVTVMVLPPNGEPYTERIDGDDYRELRRLVGGDLGSCPLPQQWRNYGFYGFCDDNAMLGDERPEPNMWAQHLGHVFLRGPVVIVRTDSSGETRSLTPANVANLELLLVQQPSKEAIESAQRELEFWQEHPSGMAVMNLETDKWE
jgi:hypothetical protein